MLSFGFKVCIVNCVCNPVLVQLLRELGAEFGAWPLCIKTEERLEWSLKTICICLILFNQRNVRYW